MNLFIFRLIVILNFVIVSLTIGAQSKKDVIKNGGFLILTDGSIYIGEILNSSAPYKIKIITGDTLTVDAKWLDKIYTPEEITLFYKSKYHYKKGFQATISGGFSSNHGRFDGGFSFLNNSYEIGLGLGIHNNSFYFSTANSHHFADVKSVPVYLKGNYYFSNNYFKPYVFGKIGYSNNFTTFNVNSVNDGIMLEGGLGVTFTSKNRSKFFIEISQYTNHAKGTMRNNDPNGLGDIGFNIWFYRFALTMGYTIGK